MCKSKLGGLTTHFRGKHLSVDTSTNTNVLTDATDKAYKKIKFRVRLITEEKILVIIRDVGKFLT